MAVIPNQSSHREAIQEHQKTQWQTEKHHPLAAAKGFFSCECRNTDSETESSRCSSAALANAHVLSHKTYFCFLFLRGPVCIGRRFLSRTVFNRCQCGGTPRPCCLHLLLCGRFAAREPWSRRMLAATAKARSGCCQAARTGSEAWHLLMEIQSRLLAENACQLQRQPPRFDHSITHLATGEISFVVPFPPACNASGIGTTSGINQRIEISVGCL